MTARPHRRRSRGKHPPTRRLLIAPAVVLVLLVIGLQLLVSATPRATDAELALIDELAPAALDEPRSCSRHEEEQATADEIRAAVTPDVRVTSAMVAACPIAFDGLQVRYAGELIGDVLHRDGGAWILVNDDDYALEVGPLTAHRDHRGTNSGLTVWFPADTLTEMTGQGRPNVRGDVVEVVGRISRTDPADGGGLTLRAESVEMLRPATSLDDPLDLPQLAFAVGAVLLGAALWVVRRRAEAIRTHTRPRRPSPRPGTQDGSI